VTVEEKVQEVLVGDSGLTTLVPASKIRVSGDDQGIQVPYIMHFPVAEIPVETYDGAAGLRMWRNYQIDIYAGSLSAAAVIRDAVLSALNGYHDSITDRIFQAPGGASDYDVDRKVAHVALDFEVAGLF
jgi:hypothetical protein